jgi:kynurenine formamidase
LLTPEFLEVAQQVSNWGRWGDDDELGTLNLIDAAAVRRGAACVRTGARFSLSLPLDEDGPQIGGVPGRVNATRTMTQINSAFTGTTEGFCTSDDVVTMGLQAATHWDALAHVSYRGQLYNGYPADSITEAGASRCGIARVESLTTRGVLLDIARARSVERLDAGYGVTPADLDAALQTAGVDLLAGDVVLVRTGFVQLFKSGDRRAYAGGDQPGLTMQTARWFHERDVAAVATDTYTFEVWPCEDPTMLLPLHLLHLRDMGLTQGQNFDLEELAESCATDGVHEFLLEASPLPFTGGCGSPVNPVAVK